MGIMLHLLLASSKFAKATQHYTGRSPGWAGGPAGCGHSKLACVILQLSMTVLAP